MKPLACDVDCGKSGAVTGCTEEARRGGFDIWVESYAETAKDELLGGLLGESLSRRGRLGALWPLSCVCNSLKRLGEPSLR